MLSTDHSILSLKYGDAVGWALQKHANQVRHNTRTPYLSHLLMTSALVIEEGADEEVAIAALLHDAVEDQPVTYEEISRNFGDRVARIVQDCTDASKGQRIGTSWRERKLAHLRRMQDFSRDSLLVITADKVSSLQSLVDDLYRFGPKLFVHSEQSFDELIWHYRETYQILRRKLGRSPLLQRLNQLLKDAERHLR